MSSVGGVSSNFGFEALAASMSKRATEAQGRAALDLLQSTVESAQQIQATAASSGHAVDIRV